MKRTFNPPLAIFTLTLCLVTVGIVVVYSASGSTRYLVKQIVFAGAGLLLMGLCYTADYRLFRRLSLPIMLGAFIMLLLVYCPGIGSPDSAREAARWLRLGPFTFQPSELAKLALVIYMAGMLSERHQLGYIKSFCSGVMPALVITGAFALVIVMEPDFGAAFVLCCVIFGMWLAAEMRWFHLIGLVLAALPAGIMFFLMEPYRWRRLIAFILRDEESLLREGWQLHQSLIAVGSGGFWGLGLGNSHQKFRWLAEPYTDFIFAIVGEELGFIGLTLLVLLFAALIFMGWLVALRSTDLFGSLLAAGITLMIFFGAAIHMGVVLGLLPTKGLVLPFISAGGSSLLVSMAAMGILMNIARHQYAQDLDMS